MPFADNTPPLTGPIVKLPHPFNHRDYLAERRQQILQQRQTDVLPSLPAETATPNKIISRQVTALRGENMHLRAQLSEIQVAMDALRSNHHMESQYVQERLQEVLTERDALQDAYQQMEQRYNELYNSFSSAVEEEAFRMVAEATNTLELSYDDDLSTQNDVKKTVKLYVRRAEDKQTAHTLYFMRQAQRKAARLEAELEHERQRVAEEHERLHHLQESVREQVELRQKTIEEHLRAKFSGRFALGASGLLIVLYLLQILSLLLFHVPITLLILFALLAPLVVGIIVAAAIAYFRSTWREIVSQSPYKQAPNV
jgi:hypothetical protein